MPKFAVQVFDTITFERVWNVSVDADDADAAEEIALEHVNSNSPDPDDEEQVDNTPYEAIVEEIV